MLNLLSDEVVFISEDFIKIYGIYSIPMFQKSIPPYIRSGIYRNVVYFAYLFELNHLFFTTLCPILYFKIFGIDKRYVCDEASLSQQEKWLSRSPVEFCYHSQFILSANFGLLISCLIVFYLTWCSARFINRRCTFPRLTFLCWGRNWLELYLPTCKKL